MALAANALSAVALSSDELAPIMRPTPDGLTLPSTDHFVLLRAARAADVALVQRIAGLLSRELDATRGAEIESQIRRLTEVLVSPEELAQVDHDLAADNAALRAEYLRTEPSYSAEELNRLCNGPKGNRSEPGSRWLRERKLFALKYGRENRFPAFQLADGAPRPVIAQVLAALPSDFSAWETAFWFASGNGWLGGDAPQDRLRDTEAVIAAAGQLREPAVG